MSPRRFRVDSSTLYRRGRKEPALMIFPFSGVPVKSIEIGWKFLLRNLFTILLLMKPSKNTRRLGNELESRDDLSFSMRARNTWEIKFVIRWQSCLWSPNRGFSANILYSASCFYRWCCKQFHASFNLSNILKKLCNSASVYNEFDKFHVPTSANQVEQLKAWWTAIKLFLQSSLLYEHRSLRSTRGL